VKGDSIGADCFAAGRNVGDDRRCMSRSHPEELSRQKQRRQPSPEGDAGAKVHFAALLHPTCRL
jgi:hypothetical protein